MDRAKPAEAEAGSGGDDAQIPMEVEVGVELIDT